VGDDDGPACVEPPTRAYDSHLYEGFSDFADFVLGNRVDIRDPNSNSNSYKPQWPRSQCSSPYKVKHTGELHDLLRDQLDANRRDSAYLSSRRSAYYDLRDSDSSNSDGDGSQDGDCVSDSFSSDGIGGLDNTDSGAGSSDDAAVALRSGAENLAGANTERAQADAANVAIRKAPAAANAAVGPCVPQCLYGVGCVGDVRSAPLWRGGGGSLKILK
jgi:hypothetical protein